MFEVEIIATFILFSWIPLWLGFYYAFSIEDNKSFIHYGIPSLILSVILVSVVFTTVYIIFKFI